MTIKDVKSYLENTHADEKEKISILSMSSNGKILVEDEKDLFNFDEITKKLYSNKKIPSSADALFATDKRIVFIEYKNGFKKRILI